MDEQVQCVSSVDALLLFVILFMKKNPTHFHFNRNSVIWEIIYFKKKAKKKKFKSLGIELGLFEYKTDDLSTELTCSSDITNYF